MQFDRRTFIEAVGASALAAAQGPSVGASTQAAAGSGSLAWRREFPALGQQVNGHPIAYLDSAATTQRPRAVIDAISGFYERDNANPGATLHAVARRAADYYGAARATVARFLNAAGPSEVIFTKGTTEAMQPARISTTVSASTAASSRSCVTYTMVTCNSCRSC